MRIGAPAHTRTFGASALSAAPHPPAHQLGNIPDRSPLTSGKMRLLRVRYAMQPGRPGKTSCVPHGLRNGRIPVNSRELCRRAIEFDDPERLPLAYGSCGALDFGTIPYTPPKGWEPCEPGADEWGAIWEKTEVENMGQMVRHPITDWSQLKDYTFPNPNVDSRYDYMEERLQLYPGIYAIAISDTVLTLWERYYSLRGFTQALTDFYQYPSQMNDLLERVLDVHLGFVRNIKRRFGGRIDAFFVSDDWGTETTTLIAPHIWRQFFKARYTRLCDAIHAAGMHAILHTDGHINELIPDFIDVGFDVLNLHSPTVVGIKEVGRTFAGKIAFMPCIDIQNTFVNGTPAQVRAEARSLLEHWGIPHGGILPCEYDIVSIGAPKENLQAAYDAYKEYGLDCCGAAHRATRTS